ncbi:MAG: GNAT family N-acetyltransferase [Bryobacterales bacterium]|nr:GNAT family N-acetyltransferase [Bryobacterales bacterium]
MTAIRDVRSEDLRAVLEINELSVPAMNHLSMKDMRWFAQEAEYFRVARIESEVGGFLICLRPETPYDSPNLAWLKSRFDDFLYVDRIAVAPRFQRAGVATALYLDASRHAGGRFGKIACEVNIRPRNEVSIRYHERLGFRPCGSQDHGYVKVRYMLAPLPLVRR